MWTRSRKQSEAEFAREFERGVLRSTFVSVFWAVIEAKKKAGKFTFKELADKLGRDKSAVSRWFTGEPNWEISTVADIASALDVEIRVMAVDRGTGRRFAPFGEVTRRAETETQPVTIPFISIAGLPAVTTSTDNNWVVRLDAAA